MIDRGTPTKPTPCKFRSSGESNEQQLTMTKSSSSSCSSSLEWPWLPYLLLGFPAILLYIARRHRRRLPPGPPGLPVIGNLLQLTNNPHLSLSRLAAKYGPIITLSLGTKTAVVVSSSEAAREFLKTNDRIFAERGVVHSAKSLGHNERSIIFGDQTRVWKLLRRVCTTNLFNVRSLDALQSLRHRQICMAIDGIRAAAAHGRQVNLRDEVHTALVDLVGTMCFSRHMFARHSPQFKEFKKAVFHVSEVAASANIVDFFPLLRPLDPQRVERNTTAYLQQLYAHFQYFIDLRLKENACGKHEESSVERDLLDSLLDVVKESDDLTISDLRVFFADIFSAATDTSSVTIEWAMSELINDPAKMKTLQKELDEIIGRERLLTESDLSDLPYLTAVMKETLRIHPAVPLLLPHRSNSDCEIGGYVIPKDTKVLFNAWAIGRDPTVWKERSTEFWPERFMDKESSGKNFTNSTDMIPFGFGRRMCVGMPLALRIVPAMIGGLVHSFDWVAAGNGVVDLSERFGVTLEKASPLLAIPTPRLSPHVYPTFH